ncbi:PIG-L deacetylase family protein [Sphingomonas sanxanigenens]|uniref:PIG-L deacetylase family protein n=1 Tax=Sphingomonas sanxanigenens TaxID=397260 RepID=UPI00046D1DCF|nr:PIG-L family deacetylase [Sphingomonas sanxanigenens]
MNPEPLDRSVWARSRWLVIAPHPDDETLGAGALIGQAARGGRLGGILYLTDGSGSHPDGTPRLAAARRAEARAAIRRLSPRGTAIDWVGWQDAHPHAPGSPRFDRDVAWLAAMLRRRRIDAIAVTDRAESHCDHVAAFGFAAAAVRQARRRVALFAYHVWSAAPPNARRRIRTAALRPGHRRHALRAHRSQLSPVMGDGFRLSAEQCRMTPFDILDLCRVRA